MDMSCSIDGQNTGTAGDRDAVEGVEPAAEVEVQLAPPRAPNDVTLIVTGGIPGNFPCAFAC